MADIFTHPDYEHSTVAFTADPKTGLKAIIAIHNTALGPAIGGCRMMPYASQGDALRDVLRLSKGMTYKCAIGGIPFGGGKAVIIGDPQTQKTTPLLHAMGAFVDQFGGRYITSFDAGTTLEDVATMGEATAHVGGITPGSGNASQSTAYGVFTCMKRAAKHVFETDSLSGLSIAIQGAGNVGSRLARLVAKDGGQVIICDADRKKAEIIAAEVGGAVGDPASIISARADIFAPCAYGGILNDESIAAMQAKVVCGGANNQLAAPYHGDQLKARGIFYCPDYLANAGGIIDLHYQINGVGRAALRAHLDGLARTLEECATSAAASALNMAQAADRLAETRFKHRT